MCLEGVERPWIAAHGVQWAKMGGNGNSGIIPIQFLALPQALLKAAAFMAQAALECSVAQPGAAGTGEL